MYFALALATLLVPSPALNRADQANATFTQCLFKEVRFVQSEDLALPQAQARVRSACQNEEAAMITSGAAVLRAKGERGALDRMRQLTATLRERMLHLLATQSELARIRDHRCAADHQQCSE